MKLRHPWLWDMAETLVDDGLWPHRVWRRLLAYLDRLNHYPV